MKKLFAVLLLVGSLVGCGGGNGSPTAPTPSPTPVVSVPVAKIVESGVFQFADCWVSYGIKIGCSFQGVIQNVGTGCAINTTVVAHFFDANNTIISSMSGTEYIMGTQGSFLTSRIIRPNEIVVITTVNPVNQTYYVYTAEMDRAKTHKILLNWQNVACQ